MYSVTNKIIWFGITTTLRLDVSFNESPIGTLNLTPGSGNILTEFSADFSNYFDYEENNPLGYALECRFDSNPWKTVN